jgi:hypothetical protein
VTTDVIAAVKNQSTEELADIVRQILGEDATPLGELQAEPIGRSAGSGTAGIFHVAGSAQTEDGTEAWSAVVKALGEPRNYSPTGEQNATREVEVYRSDAFAQRHGGVRAAHCYAIQPREEYVLIWLEDLTHAPQPPWSADLFLGTARNLGQFNGHWPEDSLPRWDWLSYEGFRSEFTRNPVFQDAFERLPNDHSHPLMSEYLTHTSVDELLQFWRDCDDLLAMADTTSRGVCHNDCHTRNLFPVNDEDGESYTVGIDWVKVGVVNLGLDIGHLLSSPMIWLELTPEEAEALSGPVLDAYLAGLADAGWSGNADGVTLTFLTRLSCGAIRTTNAVSLVATKPGFSEQTERLLRLPMAEIIDGWGSMVGFCIARRNEAKAVAGRLVKEN